MPYKRKKKKPYVPKSYPFNTETQVYKNIRLTLRPYHPDYYAQRNAKRFTLGDPLTEIQNIWIPNACLLPDATLKPGVDLNWIFRKRTTKIKLGYANETDNPFMQQSIPYQERLKTCQD